MANRLPHVTQRVSSDDILNYPRRSDSVLSGGGGEDIPNSSFTDATTDIANAALLDESHDSGGEREETRATRTPTTIHGDCVTSEERGHTHGKTIHDMDAYPTIKMLEPPHGSLHFTKTSLRTISNSTTPHESNHHDSLLSTESAGLAPAIEAHYAATRMHEPHYASLNPDTTATTLDEFRYHDATSAPDDPTEIDLDEISSLLFASLLPSTLMVVCIQSIQSRPRMHWRRLPVCQKPLLPPLSLLMQPPLSLPLPCLTNPEGRERKLQNN